MEVQQKPHLGISTFAGLAVAAVSFLLFMLAYTSGEERFSSCVKIVAAVTGVGLVLTVVATAKATDRSLRRFVVVGLVVAAGLELCFGGFVSWFSGMGDV